MRSSELQRVFFLACKLPVLVQRGPLPAFPRLLQTLPPSPGASLAQGGLAFSVTRRSRPMLFMCSSRLGSRRFSNEPGFFFVGIRDPGLGSGGAQCYLTLDGVSGQSWGTETRKRDPVNCFHSKLRWQGVFCVFFFNLITLIVFVFFLYKYTIAYWLCVCMGFKITVTLLLILLF